MSNTIELDIDEVEIPVGCWQVVCKHVPKNVYVFVRLANGIEVRQSMINPYRQEASEDVPEPEKDYEQRMNLFSLNKQLIFSNYVWI